MGASSLLLQAPPFSCLETDIAALVLKFLFSNSKALQVSCAGQAYSSKDDLQKTMKAVLERELLSA